MLEFNTKVRTRFSLISLQLLWCLTSPLSSNAQIIPDSSLQTSVTSLGNALTINGGTTVGNNLFHSFTQLSLRAGQEAYFNNPTTIQNIFSRVTGGSVSSIDGLIRANGNANLFLLNPNGILFGPNAQLNLGGSFFATTADSIRFSDASLFGVGTGRASVISGTKPESLIFGQHPGSIIVQGDGHSLSMSTPESPVMGAGFSSSGLSVQPGKSITLIGGDVDFEGGLITARGGQISIGSFSTGEVPIIPSKQGWFLNSSPHQSTLDIHLSNQAMLDVSGSGGVIQLVGHNIVLEDGSAILSQNQGFRSNGSISVLAAGELVLSGTSDEGGFPTFLGTQTLTQGYAGDIQITARDVSILNGARISSISYGSGSGGEINLKALNSVLISGTSPGFTSTLATGSFSTGNSSEINVNSPAIFLEANGSIVSLAYGSGNAANIFLNTQELNLDNAAIYSVTLGSGNSGNIDINTQKVSLLNAGILALTIASGNSGNIDITADSLSLLNSSILASTFASGDSGIIKINADTVILNNSNLLADAIPVSSTNSYTSVFSSQIPQDLQVTGKPGEVEINANSVNLLNNSSILAGTFSPQGGGAIKINANSILLDNNIQVSTSSFSSATAGDITIQANDISLSNNSTITSSAYGIGTSGNIYINSDNLTLINDSLISTSSLTSSTAGDITITANTLHLSDSSIKAKIDTDVSSVGGNIFINASQYNIGTQSPTNTNGGNITIDTKLLWLSNSTISASNQGFGKGGNINITAQNIVADSGSSINANSQNNFGGNINIVANGAVFSPHFTLSATSALGSQFSGSVILKAATLEPGDILPPPDIIFPTQNNIVTCQPNQELTYLGTGGRPMDLRDSISLADFHKLEPIQAKLFITDRETGEKIPLIEPVGWKYNADGTASFVANKAEAVQYASQYPPCQQAHAPTAP